MGGTPFELEAAGAQIECSHTDTASRRGWNSAPPGNGDKFALMGFSVLTGRAARRMYAASSLLKCIARLQVSRPRP